MDNVSPYLSEATDAQTILLPVFLNVVQNIFFNGVVRLLESMTRTADEDFNLIRMC